MPFVIVGATLAVARFIGITRAGARPAPTMKYPLQTKKPPHFIEMIFSNNLFKHPL